MSSVNTVQVFCRISNQEVELELKSVESNRLGATSPTVKKVITGCSNADSCGEKAGTRCCYDALYGKV